MLHLLDHPLGAHVVTHLRDETTKPITFRTLSYQISLLLALEATRDLPTRSVSVKTPLETHQGMVLDKPIVVVPILRAGLGMLQAFTDLFPETSIGYIGLERDPETALPRSYYCKLPPLERQRVIIVDPMLATGGSAVQALALLRQHGATDLNLVCVVAAPEGIAAVAAADPEVTIWAAVLDRELNKKRYILPGLGDFGDRLYGT